MNVCIYTAMKMDIGTRGHKGRMHLPLLTTQAKCAFLCNLVAFLENFENAKMNRKIPGLR